MSNRALSLHASHPMRVDDPNPSGLGRQETEISIRGGNRRRPGSKTNAVKSEGSHRGSSHQQISIVCLKNPVRDIRQEPVLHSPHFVLILRDAFAGIKRQPIHRDEQKRNKRGIEKRSPQSPHRSVLAPCAQQIKDPHSRCSFSSRPNCPGSEDCNALSCQPGSRLTLPCLKATKFGQSVLHHKLWKQGRSVQLQCPTRRSSKSPPCHP